MADLLYPRKTSPKYRILAWIVWVIAVGVFITLVSFGIAKAIEAQKNPSAAVEEVIENPLRLPAIAVCPWDELGINVTYKTNSSTCGTNLIGQPNIDDCGAKEFSLFNDDGNGGKEVFRKCVMFNEARTVKMKINFEELTLSSLLTFPPNNNQSVTSFRAAWIFPTELTAAKLSDELYKATVKNDQNINPLKRFSFIDLRHGNIGSLTKSTRVDINGKKTVDWEVTTTAASTDPDLAGVLNVTDYIAVNLNVGTFRVINTKETNPFTFEIVVALVGGLWIYVPFIFALFFTQNEKTKQYEWRGFKRTLGAIIGAGTKQHAEAQAEEMTQSSANI